MPHNVSLGTRDLALLGLLAMTPAFAAQIRKASITFGEEPFRDERRVRERLQALGAAGLVRSFPAAISGGGLMHCYRITTDGFRALEPESTSGPSRASLAEIAPSRFKHAMVTADIIVHTLVAAHTAHVRIGKFHGDNQLTLTVGEFRAEPDCHFQFEYGDRVFNVLVEVDNATEPLDSPREQSIRSKLLGYEAYQDWVLSSIRAHPDRRSGQQRTRPTILA